MTKGVATDMDKVTTAFILLCCAKKLLNSTSNVGCTKTFYNSTIIVPISCQNY